MRAKKGFIRFFIIFLWVIILFSPLYIPKIFLDKNIEDDRSITVFTWSEIFDPEVVHEFETQTGIKVHFNYYSTNEELIVKLKKTHSEGYDLVIPSDYAVTILRNADLIKKLDHSQIEIFSNFDTVYPILKGHSFDPANEYSIPFIWEVFGFAYDKEFFENRSFEGHWAYIFDPKLIDYKIAMTNDSVEAYNIAAFYKYGPVDTLSEQQKRGVEDLLTFQKAWVGAYGSIRNDYFVALQNYPIGISSSSYVFITQRMFPKLGFKIATPYSFITIENICLPKKTQKDAYVYEFINFILKPENFAQICDQELFFPPMPKALEYLQNGNQDFFETLEKASQDDSKLYFLRNLATEKEIRLMWSRMKGI